MRPLSLFGIKTLHRLESAYASSDELLPSKLSMEAIFPIFPVEPLPPPLFLFLEAAGIVEECFALDSSLLKSPLLWYVDAI